MPLTSGNGRGVLRAFREWRRTRPFWGGLLVLVAGVEMMVAPAAQSLVLPLNLVIYAGIAGISVYLIGILLMALGVLAWVQPQQRLFYGVVCSLLSVASFVTANFGGFVIGMLLGIVGGAMVFSWSPSRPSRPPRRRAARRTGGGKDADGGPAPAHAAVALPLALVLALPAAAAPTDWWPWDDWFGGDEGQGAPAEPGPTASPSPSPSPSGGTGGTDGADEGAEDGGAGGQDPGDGDEDAEDGEDGDRGEAGADPAECERRSGRDALAADEEEFLDAVEACKAADEEGSAPEVRVEQGDDRFTASNAESGLTADSLTMRGAWFGGVVEYPASDGPERYLRIVMSEGDVTGGELWWKHAGGRASLALPEMNLAGRDGSSVVLHVQRMTVRILGIRLTFTPDFPPPLLLPYMVVTDVDVSRPVADAAHLSVDGLDLMADREGI
ncbi:DUF6114 domain-containing protein [Nocardiopsis sp. RSe5-2]|uniref:DUF6114 domain-containing protein n=1 Tax=Nocardiopsis endophytica TaxID=3018445 RepID=A0ABT4UBJ5_9ACTN|nr:DUF6114 domain-containing protein [Nocardiopsis endophytica]MDA2814344.1 DUF6114 domain-containing protein [Nocardiopsis endophytica]